MTDSSRASMPASPGPTDGIGLSAGQLRSLVQRIERLEEEKKSLADDIKEVYAEAKGHGFDVKILRKVVSLRKKDRRERAEEEELLALYLAAIDGQD